MEAMEAAAQLQDILQAAGVALDHSARLVRDSRWHALAADAALPELGPHTWVVQGSVRVTHAGLVLDTLLPGTPIPAHARHYALHASASGAVVAEVDETIAFTPAKPTPLRAPAGPECGDAQPMAQRIRTGLGLHTLRTLQQLVLQRLGNRWPFLAIAALTMQALGLAQPIAVGFAIDEVLISEHSHAWALCLCVACVAAALRFVLQRVAHHTLFVQTPEDVVTRGLAYAAWLQGSCCGLAVVFVALINWHVAGVMLVGLLAQALVLSRAMPEQSRWAENSATRRMQRAALLRQALPHAEGLMMQGLVPTLADEAARWDAPERDPLVAMGPRVAMLVAWLSHVALIITGAILCQFHDMSVGMLVATVVINLQAHHDARAVLANAGEMLRPARNHEDARDSKAQGGQAIQAAMVPGERLALTSAHRAASTQYLHAVHTLCRDQSALSITPYSPLPAGSLRHAVARHTHASMADVLRALAWSGAETLLLHGMDLTLVADDPRLCALDKLRLHIAHALCVAPDVLLLDGVLDACGTTQAKALLLNLSRGLPHTRVVVATQRADVAALCHRQIELTEAGA